MTVETLNGATRASEGALEGIRVVECGHFLAGPFATRLLGDMGAEVIKIEKPDGGDTVRGFGGGLPEIGGESPQFLVANRNKKSVALDITTDRGRTLLLDLVARSDVFVENFSPGAIAQQGLDYETMKARNPGIVYCSISGFGHTGPYSTRRGFDLMAQGMSGLMSVTGFSRDEIARIGISIADLSAGHYAAYGVVCALHERQRSGLGQYLDIALLDSAVSITLWESAMLWSTGTPPAPAGTGSRTGVPYQVFRTADGHITIGGAAQRPWVGLCKALGRDDLRTDPRFANNMARVAHKPELLDELSRVLMTQPTAYWLERLEKTGCPCGPVYNMAQVYDDPHVRAREMIVEVEHSSAGRIRDVGSPLKLSRTPGSARFAAPQFGEHTNEVLTDILGIDGDGVRALVDEGIVRTLGSEEHRVAQP